MASDYIKMVEKQARKKLEKLNKSQQKAIFQAYYDAGKQLVKGYTNARGSVTKALYASYIKKIAEETEQIIAEYALKGAAVSPEMEKLIMLKAFQTAGLDTTLLNDTFDNAIGKLGLQSVKNVIGGGIYKDGAGLSARIWGAATKAGNDIQEIIAAGLAQDMSAAKLSKLLESYVDPAVRRTWDNEKIRSILGDGYATWNKSLEYNALRLARTTLSHTATMSMRQAKKVNPYATKIRWHSVHAAGRTCEICEEMDGQVYDIDKCPFDHPNGMCYQTHEMEKSLEEIADELAAWCKGEENEMLDEWWKSMGGTDDKPSMTMFRFFGSNEFVKNMCSSAADSVSSKFPELSKKMSITDVRYTSDDFTGSLSGCGAYIDPNEPSVLHINPNWFEGDNPRIAQFCQRPGFYPKNATPETCITHELFHNISISLDEHDIVESACQRFIEADGYRKAALADNARYGISTVSDSDVDIMKYLQPYQVAGKTISGQAQTTEHELFAEAMHDNLINGDDASEVSKFILEEVMKRL